MGSHWTPKLVTDEVQFDECSSALQKCIRRGMVYEAAYFAYLLYISGYAAYIFRRLAIIASEDCGEGDPLSAILVSSLRSSWQEAYKKRKEHTTDLFLFILQAVVHLAKAKKSRECDSLANILEARWEWGERIPVPEFALDSHVSSARKTMGKFGTNDGLEQERITRWFKEGAKITNEAYPDPWAKDLEVIWRENDKNRSSSNTQSVAKE